jgi:lysophospholipase L1-like esterase
MLALSRQDTILEIGDSTTSGFGAGTASVSVALYPLIRQAFGSPSVPPVSASFAPPAIQKWPKAWTNGVPGRKTTDISGAMTTFLAAYVEKATAAIVWLGINDALAISNATQTLLQFSTGQLAVVDALQSQWGIPYSKMLWVGPWALNGTITTFIAQVDAQCATNAALRGFTYRQISQVPFTGGNSVADGTHPTPQGAAALAAVAYQSLSFS